MGRLTKGYEFDVGEYTARVPVASETSKPPHPENGQILFNTTLNRLEVFRNGYWEGAAIVGTGTVTKDTFMGDGSTVTFSPLSYYYYPFQARLLLVFVENVYQEPDVAYVVEENTITFAEPIPNGLDIVILHGYAVVGGTFNTSPLPTFSASLTTTLIPETSVGTPMYTRANIATIIDHEGLVKQVAANEVRFMGARRVENLLTDSEDLNDVSWTKTSSGTGSAPVLTSGQTDPDGGSTAWRVELDKGAGGTSGDLSTIIGSVTSVVGHDYARSVWIRSNTGGNQVVRLRSNNASTIDVEVTTTWQRFGVIASNVATASTTETSLEILTRGDLVTTQSVDILIWHPQVEDVTGHINQTPGNYVSAEVESWPYHGAGVDRVKYFDTDNGNTLSNVYVTEQTGNTIVGSVFQGMKVELTKLNMVTYSDDFEGADWLDNSVTPVTINANAVVAPDGTLSGTTLVQNGGAIQDGLYQAVTLSTSTSYTVSCFFQAGTTTLSRFGVYDPAGVDWQGYVDVQWTGNVPSTSASSGASDILYELYANDWYRASFNFTSDTTNTTHTVQIHPDRNNSNASVSCWGCQLELATYPTSYIPTTSSTLTRNFDSYVLSSPDNIYNEAGTAYAEFVTTHVKWNFSYTRIVGTDTSNTPIFYISNAAVGFFDGTNGVTHIAPAVDPYIKTKAYSTWNASLGTSVLGSRKTVTSGLYDGTIGDGSIGIGVSGAGTVPFLGTIRNVKIWNKSLSETDLLQLENYFQTFLLEDDSYFLFENGDYLLIE